MGDVQNFCGRIDSDESRTFHVGGRNLIARVLRFDLGNLIVQISDGRRDEKIIFDEKSAVGKCGGVDCEFTRDDGFVAVALAVRKKISPKLFPIFPISRRVKDR